MSTTSPSEPIPSRMRYVAAALVAAIGILAFAIFLIVRLSGLGSDFHRVTAPADTDLALEAGAYTIFHEQGGAADARIVAGGNISGLRVSVTPRGAGEAVTLTPDSSSRYNISGRSGQSVFTFRISEPGTYRFVAQYDDGRTSPQALLTIGRGFMAGLLTTILIGLAIVFGAIALAAFIVVTTYRTRRRLLAPPLAAR